MSGKLEKLTIEGYSDEEFKSKEGKPFEVMFNPKSLGEKWVVKYDKTQAMGSSSQTQKFNNIEPQNFNFEFTLDGTGTAGPKIDVAEKIAEFRKLTCDYHGETHRPLFCKITWGKRPVLRCVLKDASITYTLFKPDGSPLRAKIVSNFSETIDPKMRSAIEKKSSPDLTHQRTVVQGDNLPILTYRIYGDIGYYLDVARYNRLVNFRALKAGEQITFPPLKTLELLRAQ